MCEENSFESSLKELEKIISELEQGNLPLEAQLKSFEKGVSLSRHCMKKLEEVEKKVQVLVENENGSLSTKDFETVKS